MSARDDAVHACTDPMPLAEANEALDRFERRTFVTAWWWGLICGFCTTTLLWLLLYIAWQAWNCA